MFVVGIQTSSYPYMMDHDITFERIPWKQPSGSWRSIWSDGAGRIVMYPTEEAAQAQVDKLESEYLPGGYDWAKVLKEDGIQFFMTFDWNMV